MKYALSNGEYIVNWDAEGRAFNNTKESFLDLIIELPEETPKLEFKAGDSVKIVTGIFEGTNGTYIYQDVKNGNAIVDILGHGHHSIPINDIILFDNIERVKESRKYKFRPFDKVLVKDNKHESEWRTAIFSHYTYDGFIANGLMWDLCIPYEGNEHLIGTNNSNKKK